MNRRHFLKTGSLAGITVSALGVTACHTNPGSNPDKSNQTTASDFALQEATIDALQQKMKEGTATARSLTEMYLKRIAEVDQSGPSLHAVIETNPDALSIADTMDAERKSGKLRGPLHGIPVLIKDNIDTGDQMMTTAGALALVGHKAKEDAFIVKRLREAGAVLLGKTNLSEWANFRSTRSTSGWSGRGGQTKNPYYLDRSPSGSSSGSGAAVSANLCAVAIGTETDGSVIAPSSFCGIVGIKPTVGLLSRNGIIPISKTQDTAGPMARTVKDAAILLGALTGADPGDPVTAESNGKALKDYTSFLDPNALKGKRIGIEKSFLRERKETMVAAYQQAIDVLKKQGAEIIEIELLKQTAPLGEAEWLVMQYEFKAGLNAYLKTAGAGVQSLADVIAYNQNHEAASMPYFKQEILEMSEKRGDLETAEYKQMVQKTTSARKIIDTLMKENKLDAIAGTSYGPSICIDLVNGDNDPGFYFCPPAAMAGYPHITIPMGMIHGLPIGFSFMASAYQEGTLIGLGYAFEQATHHRTAPKFLPTLYPGVG
ncbi:MAG: amidase [Bacteroidota bacterium]|nr:amidase [Bacteroidota bacterium]